MSGPAQPVPDLPVPDELRPESLDRARDEALAAFAAADSLDALAGARTSFLGDRSPVAQARKAIGGLPGPAKADAGKRVNVVLHYSHVEEPNRRPKYSKT